MKYIHYISTVVIAITCLAGCGGGGGGGGGTTPIVTATVGATPNTVELTWTIPRVAAGINAGQPLGTDGQPISITSYNVYRTVAGSPLPLTAIATVSVASGLGDVDLVPSNGPFIDGIVPVQSGVTIAVPAPATLVSGTSYLYAISAIDALSNESALSPTVNITIP